MGWWLVLGLKESRSDVVYKKKIEIFFLSVWYFEVALLQTQSQQIAVLSLKVPNIHTQFTNLSNQLSCHELGRIK